MTDKFTQSTESKLPITSKRLYYLDWLRVMAIVSMLLYHCARFFDFRNYPIQTVVRSLGATMQREFFQQWLMPLFFIISGAAIYYSLKSRRTGGFIKERALRLLIPLALIGIFVIAPPQIYLERLMDGSFSGNFSQWYPRYFDGVYPFGGNFAFQGMHLWYLLFLFFYSLIFLPIFIPFGEKNKSILSRISTLFERPLTLFLLFFPLIATALLSDNLGLGITRIMGGWDMLSYPVFFIYGYMIFSNKRIQDVIRRYSLVSIITAAILTIFYLYTQFGIDSPELSVAMKYNLDLKGNPQEISTGWVGILTLRAALGWCWIIGFLGLGNRLLNYTNRFLAYANEAVLPFYILHQTILLIVGYFVIQWDLSLIVEYMIITSTSFVVIMIIYELVVRRINLLRFLFGMNWKIKQSPQYIKPKEMVA